MPASVNSSRMQWLYSSTDVKVPELNWNQQYSAQGGQIYSTGFFYQGFVVLIDLQPTVI